MTIERFEEGFGYVVYCDICQEELYIPEAETFEEVLAKMKENGWKNEKIGDEWENLCPSCG